jgi:phage terminase large subunit-like protein
MVADGMIGAQCFVAAGSRDQAGIPFTDCKRILGSDLKVRLEVLEHNIAMPSTGSFIRPVSSEARTLDGKRVSFALMDEVHEHRDREVVNKMRAGTKGNRNSLILEITNSGFDKLSVCWEHHDKSRKVLERVLDDDEWFAFVCGLDPCAAHLAEGMEFPVDDCAMCDDWRDERVWVKPNPLLEITIPSSYLRTEVKNAVDIPSSQDMVKRLNFCIWTSAHATWIPSDRWAACGARIEDDDLVGVPCFGGLDLGQTDDFSAFALVFLLPDGRVAARMRYWIPEATLRLRPERPYSVWQRAGVLMVTDGEVSDPDHIEADVAELGLRYGVREIAYDRRFAEQMRIHLEGQGLVCVDTPQGFQLNEAIMKLEELVRAGRMCHGGDPVLAWMIANVVLKRGLRAEVRLDKAKSTEKIDGVAALCMALSRVVGQVNHEARVTVLG